MSTEFVTDAILPMFGTMMVFGIPIVAILTKHQQKMAKIFQEQNQRQSSDHSERLYRELEMMRATLTQQTILLDTLSQKVLEGQQPPSSSEVRQRLSSS